jgi:rhamnose transport system permease protein
MSAATNEGQAIRRASGRLRPLRTREGFRELGLLICIIMLCAVFEARNPSFLTLGNIRDLLANTAILGILSVGMLLVMVAGGIDLSIGATIALAGMSSALTVAAVPTIHPLLSILEGMVVGLGVGSVVGLLVARFNILPIIATLGMMNVVRGITYIVSKGAWVSAYQMSEGFKDISRGTTLGANNLVVMAVATYATAWYFLSHTRTGRRLYAVGSNPEAADVSGIPRRKLVWLSYAAMGLLAGLAGVLWVSKFASAQGDTAVGYEMSVIAACVLGGASITGGSGKIPGVIFGTILLGMLNNALPLIDVSPFWQQLIQGAVILAAIVMNVVVKRSSERRALRQRAI